MKLRKSGNVELVILRPAIIFGPRDRWISHMADTILARSAYVIHGDGICNTVYVDNLVHAIRLAMTGDGDGEAFIITDNEALTWSALYRRVSQALGSEWPVPIIEKPVIVPESVPILARLKDFAPVRAAVPIIPRNWKLAARNVVEVTNAIFSTARSVARPRSKNPWQLPSPANPAVPQQVAMLHRCSYKLPSAKARQRLGYEPLITLDEGIERTLAWLRFVAYPVSAGAPRRESQCEKV
jgi:nucleoside-diphosphate-sugar epimerase